MTNYSKGNDRFDAEAAAWDSKPETVESSRSAYQALLEQIPALSNGGSAEWSVLEVGCGTGLLSTLLVPHVRTLVGVDTSQGMIDVLVSKAEVHGWGVEKLKGICKLLEDANDPVLAGQRFDLCVSHLVFHHIPDMTATVAVMRDSLKAGGLLVISDFEDDGPHALRFHPADKHGGVERHGLKADEMKRMLLDAGLEDVQIQVAFELLKTVKDGNDTSKEPFPFLLCTGRKASATS